LDAVNLHDDLSGYPGQCSFLQILKASVAGYCFDFWSSCSFTSL